MAFELSMLHKNKNISSIVGLFLVLYGGLAKPKLPRFIRNLFENPIFRVIILALIMYRGNKDPQLSIMLSVGFTMVMNKLNEEKIKEEFIPVEFEDKVNELVGYNATKHLYTLVGSVFAGLLFIVIGMFSGSGESEEY